MKRFLLLAVAAAVIGAGSASATIIFQDDFESGLGNWTTVYGNTLTIQQTPQTPGSPPAGLYSAYGSAQADRMVHNLGMEVAGPSTFSVRMFDPDGTGTQGGLAQLLGYTGSGYQDGGVAVGVGIGEVAAIDFYQGRIVNGPSGGYYTLSVARTPGWHEFTIVRRADGTTIDFYVDGVLGGTVANSLPLTWDCIALGQGEWFSSKAGSASAYYDDVLLDTVPIPEASTYLAGALLLLPFGAGLIRKLRRA